MSYQSFLVIVLASASALFAGLLDSSSGIILAPGLALILKVLAAVTIPLATNQLKAVGSALANTTKQTIETTTTPPPAPPQP